MQDSRSPFTCVCITEMGAGLIWGGGVEVANDELYQECLNACSFRILYGKKETLLMQTDLARRLRLPASERWGRELLPEVVLSRIPTN